MSGRTLQRHLAQAGVAYQSVLDDTRHELALHYLASTTMAIAAVADLLAFQDTSAFNHAFKQWQGVAPAAYRSEVRSVS
jgi:AraC-like DNA-binding protein